MTDEKTKYPFDLSLLDNAKGPPEERVYFNDKDLGWINVRHDALRIGVPGRDESILMYTPKSGYSPKGELVSLIESRSIVPVTLSEDGITYTLRIPGKPDRSPPLKDFFFLKDRKGFVQLTKTLYLWFADPDYRKLLLPKNRIMIFFHPSGIARVSYANIYIFRTATAEQSESYGYLPLPPAHLGLRSINFLGMDQYHRGLVGLDE